MRPPPNNLADCTATELVQLYRTGRASPVEATQAVLSRIGEIDRMLNAFCLVDADRALESAKASEARWRDGAPQDLLDGVPVSIKDLILTRGWPTLRGSRTIDPRQPWDIDAPATARLREAGAVLIGKTNTPEFGIKGTTDNLLTGITRNPWNSRMTPGGSSGGAAAAVASGMGPLAVGTDGAGSIRIPSTFCGIPGIKPSFGRVPAFPLSPFGTVAHIGPHARSVEDLALMLTVMSRPDARDWTSLPYDPRDYRVGLADGVRGLRIAFSPDLGYVKNVDPEVAAAVRNAAESFSALGAHVDEAAPGFADPEEITTKLWFVGSMTIVGNLTPEQVALTDPALRWQAERRAQGFRGGIAAARVAARRARIVHAPVPSALRSPADAGRVRAGLRGQGARRMGARPPQVPRLDTVFVSLQSHAATGGGRAVRTHPLWPADLRADRRSDARRCAGAARRARVRVHARMETAGCAKIRLKK